MPHRYSPSHWAAGAGGVARKALQVLIKDSVDNCRPDFDIQLQALEGLKLAEKDPNGGRRLTSQVCRDLDCIASACIHVVLCYTFG